MTDDGLENILKAAFRPVPDAERDRLDALADAVKASAHRRRSGVGDAIDETRLAEVDRYTIEGEIGRGGVGVVLKGRDCELGRDVAIKVLSRHHLTSPPMKRRFVEEAQIGGQLQHPGIVPVHDIGHDALETPYFTMRLVQGQTLADLLRERASPLEDRRRYLTVFEKICQTVAYAHDRGVVHRDLKPSNVMVGAFGEVQVMDWGLAKVLEAAGPERVEASPGIETVRTKDDTTRSLTGSVMGTPSYMPPEQARGEVDAIDARADVFALGAMLAEILTEAPPYQGKTRDAIKEQAAAGALGACYARLEAADADPELKRLARRCLEADPARRPDQAGVVADALTDYLASVDDRLRAAELAAARAEARAAGERRARRMTVVTAVTVVLALIAGVVTLIGTEAARRSRTARIMAEVGGAEAEARASLRRALRGAAPDSPLWSEAEAAAHRAVALAKATEVDASDRERVTRLHARIDAAKAAADKDADMVHRLDAIRVSAGPFAVNALSAMYATAFRAYGIDVVKLDPDAAAARIRSTAIAPRLVNGLYGWMATQVGPDAGEPFRHHLLAVLDRLDPDPFRQRLRGLLRKNDYDTLKRHAEDLDAHQEPLETVIMVAHFLGVRGALEEPVALLERAYPEHMGSFWLLFELAAWLAEQRSNRALAHMRAAVALRPDSAEVRAKYGYVLGRLGNAKEGEVQIRVALEMDPRCANAHYFLSKAQSARGNHKGAIESLSMLVRLLPEVTMYRLELADALSHVDLDRAIELLEELVRESPDSALRRFSLGVALMKKKDVDRAIASFEAALDVERRGEENGRRAGPEVSRHHDEETTRLAYHNLGIAWFSKGNYRRGIACYREFLALDPKSVPARLALGQGLTEIGDHASAVAVLEEATRIDSESGGPHWNLGLALFSAGRYDEAMEVLEKALERLPEDAQKRAWARRVRGYAREAGRFEEILADEADPEGTREAITLARYCLNTGRTRRGAEILRAVVEEQEGSRQPIGIRVLAAQAAAAAGTGRGRDVRDLEPTARAAWRARAREWLEVCLEQCAALLEQDDPGADRAVRRELMFWTQHLDFEGIRDSGKLATLPPDERAELKALWTEVETLLAKAEKRCRARERK